MNINREMVNIFFEVKRSLPHSKQQSLKISNADLGQAMVGLYKSTKDERVKGLIKIFLEQAGGVWIDQVSSAKQKHFYRGQEISKKSEKKEIKNHSKKKQRIYRGQLVED